MNQIHSKRKIRSVLTDVQKVRHLAGHVWRHFKEDRCFDEAASLSYTSLLSLVPLLAVVFGIVSAFPVFEQWSDQLKEFLIGNMVPDSGELVEQYLEQFLGSVNKLTLTGTFFLIITALLLMMRIEASLNLIWRVTTPRSLINKITMYWAVLTLGPLALGVATALSAQPLFELIGTEAVTSESMRSLGIFTLTWISFCLIFLLVPNCKVPFSYAALGAFVSTVLFSLAKTAFVAFISRASYTVIYGAMATVPIFLFWLYVVWAVILLGASLAASLTTFSERHSDWRWPPSWDLLLVVRLLGHFYAAQEEGELLSTEDLLEAEPGVALSHMQVILRHLLEQNLITQDAEQRWVLKRDLGRFTLGELYGAGDYHLPIGKSLPVPSTSPWDEAFLELLNAPQLDLDHSLASLYATTEPATP